MASRLACRRLATIRPSARCGSCLPYRSVRLLSTPPVRPSFLLLNTSRPSPAISPCVGHVQLRTYAEKIIQVPQMAESITEGTLKLTKKVGDYVERDEELASIETDKVEVAVNAPDSGVVVKLFAQEEDTVTVGQDLLAMDLGAAPQKSDEAAGAKEEPKEEPKAAAESSQDPSSAEKQDHAPPPETPKQENVAPKEDAQPKPAPPKQPEAPPQPRSTSSEGPFNNREERRVKMNRMRLRIAERLKESQNTAASLTTFNEIDMSNLLEMRNLYKDMVMEKTGVKLGFMSAFSRAVVEAMKDVPTVNASIEGPNGGDTIVYRDYVDISVAVATEKGLVTPVVRNAESLGMVGIESAIAELGRKARKNQLTIEDMAGGTFTISNGGVFGSLYGTPIINLPQTAVLGLHAIKQKPVAINGAVQIRPVMIVALTYDHRLLDGREAVTFLVKIKNYIEDPRRLLLGV